MYDPVSLSTVLHLSQEYTFGFSLKRLSLMILYNLLVSLFVDV